MTTQDPFLALTTRLAPLADPVRAAAMRAYQRDQFDFLGIPTPLRRAAVKAWAPSLLWPALLELASRLWDAPEREYQYAAIDLLDLRRRELPVEAVGALLALARRKPWWESVDGLAGVIGKLVRAHREAGAQEAMDAALHDESFWIRRIAMTHQLGWRLETDEARLFGYALRLAPEREFFIRKAIGWALRDYAKWAPQAVGGFVAAQCERLSPLTVREATKHLA
jgi:3-methyladenine DNA glycosylase AlkD